MSSKSAVRLVLPLLFVLWVGLGCSLSDVPLPFWPFQPGLTFINHPIPNIISDISPFTAAGCAQEKGYPYITCPVKSPPFDAFGCTVIRPLTHLGGLQPKVAIAQCTVNNADRSKTLPNVYYSGCLMRQYVRYIVHENGKFRLLSTLDEFKAYFGPIESPDEALSYAVATTGLFSRYNHKPEPLRYKTDRIEDTYVEKTGDSFRVHLFYYKTCGCGPHGTSSVDVSVSRAGDVQQSEKTLMYEDPTQDGLCVD